MSSLLNLSVPGLFAKALANVNIGSLICTTGADGFALAIGPAPFTSAAPNISPIHRAEKQEQDCGTTEATQGLLLLNGRTVW
jgi:large subunit ribosomal protein LP1